MFWFFEILVEEFQLGVFHYDIIHIEELLQRHLATHVQLRFMVVDLVNLSGEKNIINYSFKQPQKYSIFDVYKCDESLHDIPIIWGEFLHVFQNNWMEIPADRDVIGWGVVAFTDIFKLKHSNTTSTLFYCHFSPNLVDFECFLLVVVLLA